MQENSDSARSEQQEQPYAMKWGAPPSNGRPKSRRRSRIVLVFVGLIALAAILLVSVNVRDIGGFVQNALAAEPGWLLLAALTQLTTYACAALVWHRVLTRMEARLPFLSLYPLSVAKLFADQALPSGGLAGALFFLHSLGQRSVPQKTAFSVFVFATASFFAAFLAGTMVSLFALAAAETAPPALTASVIGFSAVIMLLGLIGLLTFVLRPKATPTWIARIPRAASALDFLKTAASHIGSQRILFLEAAVIQFFIRVIDGATLFLIFLAIGAPAEYGACFVAVMLASVAATIGPVPMGLGTFEAGMVGALSVYGVAVEEALTATLIFRGVSLWLPLIPGFVIIQRELLRAKTRKENDTPVSSTD